jgi:hypothetical protein
MGASTKSGASLELPLGSHSPGSDVIKLFKAEIYEWSLQAGPNIIILFCP